MAFGHVSYQAFDAILEHLRPPTTLAQEALPCVAARGCGCGFQAEALARRLKDALPPDHTDAEALYSLHFLVCSDTSRCYATGPLQEASLPKMLMQSPDRHRS